MFSVKNAQLFAKETPQEEILTYSVNWSVMLSVLGWHMAPSAPQTENLDGFLHCGASACEVSLGLTSTLSLLPPGTRVEFKTEIYLQYNSAKFLSAYLPG